jgi:hypothetical protein
MDGTSTSPFLFADLHKKTLVSKMVVPWSLISKKEFKSAFGELSLQLEFN